jgi:hypothetical protein
VGFVGIFAELPARADGLFQAAPDLKSFGPMQAVSLKASFEDVTGHFSLDQWFDMQE